MTDIHDENIKKFISQPDVAKRCIKYYFRKRPPKYETFCKLLSDFRGHAIDCKLIIGDEDTLELYNRFIIFFEARVK